MTLQDQYGLVHTLGEKTALIDLSVRSNEELLSGVVGWLGMGGNRKLMAKSVDAGYLSL